MKWQLLVAAAICTILSALALGLIRGFPTRAQQSGPLIGFESLRAQAKRAGHVTAAADPRNLHRHDGVGTLTRESTAIVVGSVYSQAASLLPPNENLIVTDYQVTIQEVLKGSVQPGQGIMVREPGGQVQFSDGTSAEVDLPDYWKNPRVGGTYVLFLESRSDGHFVLTGGPQGLFEIAQSDSISPQARPEDKLTKTYSGRGKEAFIEEIREALAQK